MPSGASPWGFIVSRSFPRRAPEPSRPRKQEVTPLQASRGLYDPSYEHDACGVAFVARVRAPASHEVVARALHALERLEHRGAEGADPDTGDGAGILIQLPDEFLRAEAGFELPEPGRYGVAVCFLPPGNPAEAMRLLEERVEAEGQNVLGWREVPVNEAACGSASRAVAPRIAQLFVGAGDDIADQDAFERKLYVIRRTVERADLEQLAIPSFSSRTMVHKGMLTAPQLPRYFPDLRDERVVSRARARPLALLDQHLPQLGARPPVPHARPQRRDQHAARQPQLDARPRAPARLAAVRRRHRQDPPAAARRHLRLGLARRPDGAARARRPLAPRTRCRC